jgi:hypothetical protein
MNDARINIPLSPALKDRVKAAADRDGAGLAEWVRFAIRRALTAQAADALVVERLRNAEAVATEG